MNICLDAWRAKLRNLKPMIKNKPFLTLAPKPNEIVVYISGAISDIEEAIYTAAFKKGADEAREYFDALAPKVKVINPVEHNNGKHTKDWLWIDYMRADICLLMQCNAIYMLEGWHVSRGARVERRIASDLGFNVVYQTGARQAPYMEVSGYSLKTK